MTDPQRVRVADVLVALAGGYLRNPGGAGTCARCHTPIVSASLCGDCFQAPACIDRLGFVTYAGYLDPISQSGYMMRGYKNPSIPASGPRRTVTLLAALALLWHTDCAGRLAGAPVTAWSSVPSLPPKPDLTRHPLSELVEQLYGGRLPQVHLLGSANVSNPRSINPLHFSVVPPVASFGHHVLLIDDTWTGGGHVTSAALALRAGGAAHVSVLVLARWLAIGWGATTLAWARSRLTEPDFNPNLCPWTQGPCS